MESGSNTEMAIHICRLAKKIIAGWRETENETAAVVCSGSVKAEAAMNTLAKAPAKKTEPAKTPATRPAPIGGQGSVAFRQKSAAQGPRFFCRKKT
jgi:hypothetical protein